MLLIVFAGFAFAQKAAAPKPSTAKLVSVRPTVKRIDTAGLRKLLKPNGKPLLINFWATWCDPCREEFPELVKIDAEYKGNIDLITVSLDDLAEINRDVPKFLAEMKASMPAFLLKAVDEDAAIATVSRDWTGGLPFTILIDEKGGVAFTKQGKVKIEDLRGLLNALTLKPASGGVH